MKIQKLPEEVRSKLQSGLIITDAVQCVLELVHNSLDAEATGIAVRVDLKTYQIRVIDNGKGIGKDDLEFVGEKYMTSKYRPLLELDTSFPMYGFKGQALSSLRDVSRSLTIETRSEDGGVMFIKVFKNNKALPISEGSNDRIGTGTVVTIDDFMYSMPVRRKRISKVFDMEEIKNQLQYLAIIHYNVCFTLRNENKGLILLQTPQASSILESVGNIYGKTIAKSLKALHYEEKNYEVTGFMSLKPQTQGNLQLLYINKRVVSKGVIHKFVNRLIKEYCGKKSLFGDSPTGGILKRLKSSHNVFIIQIKCPHSYYELFTNIRKVTVEFRNWKDPLKCIHKAVKRTFKDVFSMDKSNFHCHDDKAQCNKEAKGVFGTSLLINAVRGAAVKRPHDSKAVKSRKKMKLSGTEEKSDSLEISKNLKDHGKVVDELNTTVQENECSNDTMESPIPKKSLKKVNQIYDSEIRKGDIDQSFRDFYKWLKANFETDKQAFNVYNDFLQFKNRPVPSDEVTQFRSPVLGVKLKRKQAMSVKKKTVKKKVKTPDDLSVLNHEMAIVTQRQLKIFPNQHLRMKKAVQFTAEMNSCLPDTLNIDCHTGENENFGITDERLFKKPEYFPILKRKEQMVEYNQTLQSLPSSEVQFTNIIKFRNLSDSFFRRSLDGHAVQEKTFSASNTWVSHYQESENLDQYEMNHNVGNFVSLKDRNEWRKYQREMDINELDLFTAASCLKQVEFPNNKRVFAHDAGVQVNIPNMRPKKANAVVQTCHEVPESPSFEESYVFTHGEGITSADNQENDGEPQKAQFSEKNFSQDVPNPDFWNSTTYMQLELNTQPEVVYDDVDMTSNKFSEEVANKKNSTSNEFVCGHKSQLSTKVESTSKETQTLAAIWTDSLTDMGCPPENMNAGANSKSENIQLSESNAVPKTIPIDEINCDVRESGFCVTERHDFVPKGLSPKFLNPESTTVAPLSPSEKNKIKLTIDNAENDFLANIKWQNESTGDCLKPAIPDGTVFEIRRKAGEIFMNYENPVLSATLSYCALKVHNLLHSFAFTKELLSGVEVLGQLDKKFIVTKMRISTPRKMELISLFDQHAADERIKLEELINENISSCGKFISSPLNPPIECTVTPSVVQIVSSLKEKMPDFGLGAEPVNENALRVSEVPTFLLRKHEYDIKNKKETSLADTVRALILNIIEEATETRGAASKIPKVIHNAFCLEACHKAIKFNRPLSLEDMTEMISKLQNCKLPFQCAHGRPSVVPIIDLEDFRSVMEESEAPDFEKFRKFLNERKDDSVMENSKTA